MAQAVAVKSQVVKQYGPYGSQLPETFRFQLAEGERISEFSVWHGAIIDAIGFVVTKKDGSTYTQKFGGNTGNLTNVKLKSGEYLTSISGTYGNYPYYQEDGLLLGTLKIYTNLNPAGYGPYGKNTGQSFESPKLSDSLVAGMLGRSNKYVESLGVLMAKNYMIEQYGPYGSQLPETFRFQLVEGERISEFSVWHGAIIDAIGFVVTKKDGSTYTQKFGGNTGNLTNVKLKAGEYLTSISGTYGNYPYYQKDGLLLGTLKIYTNLNPAGYGPYGKNAGQSFESPKLSDSLVAGMFGRSNKYVESLGVLMAKNYVIEQYGPYGSQLPATFGFQLPKGERISEFFVWHGAIIDAIGFVVTKQDGSTYNQKFGGNTGNLSNVKLKAGEYLTGISGTYGNYPYYQKDGLLLGTLKIYTNLNQAGYGPYGKNAGQTFESPKLVDVPVVGTCGRSGKYVESLGVFVRKEFSKAN